MTSITKITTKVINNFGSIFVNDIDKDAIAKAISSRKATSENINGKEFDTLKSTVTGIYQDGNGNYIFIIEAYVRGNDIAPFEYNSYAY